MLMGGIYGAADGVGLLIGWGCPWGADGVGYLWGTDGVEVSMGH